MGLSSRIPFKKKDFTAELYSGSALPANYDEMGPSDSSDLFRSLNT
jgi:hypothetical protein